MKALIITFSPSGNTLQTGIIIKEELEKRQIEVQLLDITRSAEIFNRHDYPQYLQKCIEQHDIICPGAPVYAHHYQYAMLDLLWQLPKPDNRWGKYALPFITYGHIDSGIALEEAGRILRKSGRIVISGMKIAARHTMLETLLKKKIAAPSPAEDIRKIITAAVDRISTLQSADELTDLTASLRHKKITGKIIANTIFNEKMCHKRIYPNIKITDSKCTGCGLCVKKCPVNHLTLTAGKAAINTETSCIHCFNCIGCCPQQALALTRSTGMLEKVLAFLTRNGFEKPENAIFPANFTRKEHK